MSHIRWKMNHETQAREARADVEANSLAVLNVGTGLTQDGQAVTAFLIDTSQRPDIRDLRQIIHQTDDELGTFFMTPTARLEGGYETWLILEVDIREPVACQFHLRFVYDRQKDALWQATTDGIMILASVSDMADNGLTFRFNQELQASLRNLMNEIENVLRLWTAQDAGLN